MLKVAAMIKFFTVPLAGGEPHERETRSIERMNVLQQLKETERRLTEFLTPSASPEADEPSDEHRPD
jgi:hypothetical protein